MTASRAASDKPDAPAHAEGDQSAADSACSGLGPGQCDALARKMAMWRATQANAMFDFADVARLGQQDLACSLGNRLRNAKPRAEAVFASQQVPAAVCMPML